MTNPTKEAVERVLGALGACHDVLADLIDYNDARLQVLRHEMDGAKVALESILDDPESFNEPRFPSRPLLTMVVSVAEQIGVTEAEAEHWWTCREASDWMKSTAGGGTTPVGKNWQADCRVFTMGQRQRLADGKNGHNGHARPKTETVWQLRQSIEAVDAELSRLEEKMMYDGKTIERRDMKARLQERRRELHRKIAGLET